jgi:hypothetical protein
MRHNIGFESDNPYGLRLKPALGGLKVWRQTWSLSVPDEYFYSFPAGNLSGSV